MSIRPVDLQVMLPRTSEANRVLNNDLQRPEVMQQQYSEKTQKQVQHDEQRVLSSNKSEQDAIDKDGRGNSGEQGSSRKRNRASREQDEQGTTAKSKSMFDVTI